MNNNSVIFIIIAIVIIGIVYNYYCKKQPVYNVTVYENFLSDKDCDYIITKASNKTERSAVMGSKEDEIQDYRTSTQVWLDQQNDPVLRNLAEKVSRITGKSIYNQEQMQVLNYKVGQEYQEHYDACDIETKYCKEDNERGGARYSTLLVYLNNVKEGGETAFPKISEKVTPKKGRAVYFLNLTDDYSKPHPDSLHTALPIIKGEKWAMNIWTRMNSFK